jgi:hypothetical protein
MAVRQVSLNGCPMLSLYWEGVGVRPILENSTACQKSMPSLISVFLGWLSGCFDGPGFSLVELELSQCFDLFCLAGIYPSGFVFPFALLGCWGLNINGEFDPGSGRTLAACLTHASRTDQRGLLFWLVANG